MAVHHIKKGLDLPIRGAPDQRIEEGPAVSKVAILARDYPFMKPRMHVAVGDKVLRGQLLFEDRKSDGVRFTAPGAGTVTAINRGHRRAFQSLVIELTSSERANSPSEADLLAFESFTGRDPADLDDQSVRDLLVESGLWTAIRQRPFSKVPSPSSSCSSIFVTAIDTNPLAPDPEVVAESRGEAFQRGLWALSHLTDGPIYLCRAPNAGIEPGSAPRVQVEEFAGRHPAGLVGTHIHFLDPVHREKVVWHVGYQDVTAIGELFETGRLPVDRTVALCGPVVMRARLVKTRLGAEVEPLIAEQLFFGETRVISGSVLYGHRARGVTYGYLGRYANQLTCVAEDHRRRFLGWIWPGWETFSVTRAFLSGFRGSSASYDLTTSSRGGHRAMVPIGLFEKVMPLDIMPTFLLRALLMDDIERAEALGCLELDEEDLGLCSFVSPGKEDYAPHLRRNLFEIWKEES
jgi:Na+-transporting NADH:ubiquinone oxidoreductase subunit A